MIADSLVPNSPSTASRRSPSPCTGEANALPLLYALSAYFNIILLIRLRLRLAYPLHKCNFAVLQSKISYLTAQRLNEGGFHVQLFIYIIRLVLLEFIFSRIKQNTPRFTQASERPCIRGDVLIFDLLTARSIYTLSIYLSGFLGSHRRASQFRMLTASAICRMSTFSMHLSYRLTSPSTAVLYAHSGRGTENYGYGG